MAEKPAPGCGDHASYDARKPESLLNQDNLIDDDAIVCVRPADPL